MRVKVRVRIRVRERILMFSQHSTLQKAHDKLLSRSGALPQLLKRCGCLVGCHVQQPSHSHNIHMCDLERSGTEVRFRRLETFMSVL